MEALYKDILGIGSGFGVSLLENRSYNGIARQLFLWCVEFPKMEILHVLREYNQHKMLMQGHSMRTGKKYDYVISRVISLTGVEHIEHVTEQHLRKMFLHGRTELCWKSSTYITIHKALAVFFKWCVQRGYIQTNPVLAIEKPRLEKRLPGSLTKQDALRLLEVVYNYPYKQSFERYRNHALFSVALFAGLRKQEVLNLRYTDVDIDNRTLFVYQGKGAKDRIIPMCHTLANSLAKYLTERKKVHRTCPEFFTSTVRNGGMSMKSLERIVRDVRLASKITFSMHKLRHTFATLMLEGGCDIYAISKMMGHADISTTTIYLSANIQHMQSEIMKHPLNA